MLLKDLFFNLDVTFSEKFNDVNIDHITYDSRLAAPGTLFVCIVGSISDGHNYVQSAYEKGCRAFLCEKSVSLPDDAAVILSGDNSKMLPLVSAAFYSHPADKLRIVGITGTKGKTTTALLIHDILNNAGIKTGYIGSAGVIFDGIRTSTLRTTPESTDLHLYFSKMLRSGCSVVVMEVSSQALYRERVYGIKFDTCVYTNLSEGDHIGPYEHPDFEHYKFSKSRLFREYESNFIVYNKDDEYHEYMLSGASALSTSVSMNDKTADYYGYSPSRWMSDGALGIDFVCRLGGIERNIRLRSPGRFSVYNALLAIAVCRHYGVNIDDIANSLSKISPLGRFEIVDSLPYATFVIDFAHNELSLRSALTALREYSPTRLTVLVGSVGGRTYSRRAPMGNAISECADLCILTSDDPDYEDPMTIINDILSGFHESTTPFVCIPDRKEAIEYAVNNAIPGEIILLAGKGHENFMLINGEHIPFSEKSIINAAAKNLLSLSNV